MKLIYLDPEGVSSSMIFPKVGYWKHKEIKEVDHPETIKLLLGFPQINVYEEPKPKKEEPKRRGRKKETEETEKTEFNETVEEAVEGVEQFYTYKTGEEGGED